MKLGVLFTFNLFWLNLLQWHLKLLCAWCVHAMQLVPGCGTIGTIRSGDNQLHCQDMVH